MRRVDLHSHVVPGVDDGARTMEDSLELARAAVADGTGTLVATPHIRHDHLTDVSELSGRMDELRDAVRREGIPLTLRLGGELGHLMVERLDQASLEIVAIGPRHAPWILLESPFDGLDDGFAAASDELRARGFGVLLAHPERSAEVLDRRMFALRRELLAGTMLQVNSWSLAGAHGEAARRAAVHLASGGFAAIVASDAHSGWRGPRLSLGAAALREAGLTPAAAAALTEDCPRHLVERGWVGNGSRRGGFTSAGTLAARLRGLPSAEDLAAA